MNIDQLLNSDLNIEQLISLIESELKESPKEDINLKALYCLLIEIRNNPTQSNVDSLGTFLYKMFNDPSNKTTDKELKGQCTEKSQDKQEKQKQQSKEKKTETEEKVCSVEGCYNNVCRASLCRKHYGGKKKCIQPGCKKKSKVGNLCERHYITDTKEICKYTEGCDSSEIFCFKSILCKKHYYTGRNTSKKPYDKPVI